MVSEMYSVMFKDQSRLVELAKAFGLKIIKRYTGDALQGTYFCSRLITFEKVRPTPEKSDAFFANIPRHVYDGLKLRATPRRLRGQRRIVTEFQVGSRKYSVSLNAKDRMLLEEENHTLETARRLRDTYGSIEKIPDTELRRERLGRRLQRTRYVLFKESSGGSIIVIR